MRKSIFFVIIIFSAKSLSAQVDNGFMRCSSEVVSLINSMNSSDTDIGDLNEKLIEGQKKWVECIKGKTVPDISVLTVGNDSFHLSKVKDSVIVLNFWSTSCVPCIAEIAALNQLKEELESYKVLFVSICIDSKSRFKNNNLPHFLTIDQAGDIFNNYGIVSYPQTFILSKNHQVMHIVSGATISDIEKTKAEIASNIKLALSR